MCQSPPQEAKRLQSNSRSPQCRTCQRTDQEVGCEKELLVADGTLGGRLPALHTAAHQPQEGCEVLPLGGSQVPQDRL